MGASVEGGFWEVAGQEGELAEEGAHCWFYVGSMGVVCMGVGGGSRGCASMISYYGVLLSYTVTIDARRTCTGWWCR